MKLKTMLCAVLLFLSMAAQAQNQETADSVATDSLVRVIGWFCKTDTLEYTFSQVVAEVVGTDTTVVEAAGNDSASVWPTPQRKATPWNLSTPMCGSVIPHR